MKYSENLRKWLGIVLNIILAIEVAYLLLYAMPESNELFRQCEIKTLCDYGSAPEEFCEANLLGYTNMTLVTIIRPN